MKGNQQGPAKKSKSYHIIENAIVYLAENYQSHPGLDELAAAAGLSTSRFQRVFTEWAGVSPKRFLQFVTRQHALEALRGNKSVLESSYEVGLSGAGRLHDLTVSLDGVTPGQVSSGGEGLDIAYGSHASPFGECFLACTSRGICKLGFICASTPVAAQLQELAQEWPKARIDRDQARTGELAERLFSGSTGSAVLNIKGTNFQLKVWQALLEIPPAALVSYEEIADKIGQPGSSRAVGNAVGRNPVALLIPCHRVIRKTGALGNYRWGLPAKLSLIGAEAAARYGE